MNSVPFFQYILKNAKFYDKMNKVFYFKKKSKN